MGLAFTAALAMVGTACSGSDDPVLDSSSATSTTSAVSSTGATTATAPDPGIEGVEVFAITDVDHVSGTVEYDPSPPVGGPHAAVWQNCGFYSDPVSSEAAVHSLEHGAVWITHSPDLAAEEVSALRAFADLTFVLVSPWEDGPLPAPIVASAWNRQLQVDSAADTRLAEFVEAFRMGSQSPEPGAACSSGTGDPE